MSKPTRSVRFYRPVVNYSSATIARFWSKVEVKEAHECWNWKARKAIKKPYGFFDIDQNQTCMVASRIAYHFHYGHVPLCMQVCHTCDNPSCVNPNHLRLGSNQDNMDDMKKKGRSLMISRKGEDNATSKLTEQTVLAIRARYAELGGRTKALIAREFGIPVPTVKDVLYRRRWTHI